MKFLLDTCTFLWLAADADEVPSRVRDLCADEANELYLSAVSAWEIAVKHRLGRLPLPAPPARFVVEEREALGSLALPLDEESALHLLRLPLLHRDPFDRMLVCQALVHGLAILTPDPLVAQYPARVVW